MLPTRFMLCFLIQSFRNAEPFYQVWAITAPLLCHCQAVTEGVEDLW